MPLPPRSPRHPDAPAGARPSRLLVAAKDATFRALVRARVGQLERPPAVVEAADGAEAVQLGLQLRPAVVLVDLLMPRLGGAEAATTLRELRPETAIALVGDGRRLHEAAGHLGLPLFDRLELDNAVEWVARELERWVVAPFGRAVELVCAACGHVVLAPRPPARCEVCSAEAVWTPVRRAAAGVV